MKLNIHVNKNVRTFEDTSDLIQLTEICEQLCRNLVDDLSAENWAVSLSRDDDHYFDNDFISLMNLISILYCINVNKLLFANVT